MMRASSWVCSVLAPTRREPLDVAVVEQLALAGLGLDMEFVAEVAADRAGIGAHRNRRQAHALERLQICLLYTSDAADDLLCVDLGGRRIIKKKKEIQI